jgi:DNA (cytosine-5)-methyltransferase 1
VGDEEIRVLDLFSGIGGFSLGLERAGPFRTVAFCERDEFCQAVLRKHWPDTPIYDDVRTIPTDELGRIDIISGGFPCQPWSQAGHQRGAGDDRDLWPEMLRVIEAVQSRWVVGENVRGFVNEPMGLERSLSDLEGIGYSAVPFIIPACAVDAPHRRDRVWIVANRASVGRSERAAQARWQAGDGFIGPCRAAYVADTDCSLGEGNKRAKRGEQKRSDDCKPSRWLPEPDVGRVAHGVPRRVDRLRSLGNAVVPQVVERIGRAIIEGEK